MDGWMKVWEVASVSVGSAVAIIARRQLVEDLFARWTHRVFVRATLGSEFLAAQGDDGDTLDGGATSVAAFVFKCCRQSLPIYPSSSSAMARASSASLTGRQPLMRRTAATRSPSA